MCDLPFVEYKQILLTAINMLAPVICTRCFVIQRYAAVSAPDLRRPSACPPISENRVREKCIKIRLRHYEVSTAILIEFAS